MDEKFVELYNRELNFIRESGAEFAIEYPKIAGRLGLDGFDCSDPYVERLFEGFAFLSARIHKKLDASYPDFTQHLMELLFPTFLQPIPSMLIAQLQPDFDAASLTKGYTIKKATSLFSQLAKDEQTPCEYTTAQDMTLWPIELTHAEYITPQNLGFYLEQSGQANVVAKSAIKLSFSLPQHMKVADLPMDAIEFHIRGPESLPFYIYEALCKGYKGLLYKSGSGQQGTNNQSLWRYENKPTSIKSKRLNSDRALLPFCQRQFDGFRLLREYFAFAQSFLFLELQHLQSSLAGCSHNTFELLLLLDHTDNRLENNISQDNIALHCTPAINLFSKRAERISLSSDYHDLHVVPSRMRPLDYEICSITDIQAFGHSADESASILPLYNNTRSRKIENSGYFTQARKQRLLGVKGRKYGHRSSYIGSEVYISLSDPNNPPFSEHIKQLAVNTLCCNRDLPLMMPLGKGTTDFTIETGAPCSAIRCIGEPTRPKTSINSDDTAWDLINLLSVNFLGFSSDGENESAALDALSNLLNLMADKKDPFQNKQIDGIIGFSISTVTARLPFTGPICFGRGMQIQLTVDETAFQGGSAFLLGMILDQFFACYAGINSFTQLVLLSSDRGEIHQWPIRIGSQTAI